MTRRVVYGVSLCSFLAATAMTLASIIVPEWLVYRSDIPSDNPPKHTYGLHSRCTTLAGRTSCHTFPKYSDCHSSTTSENFCSLWRTTGFVLSFAFALELATVVAFMVVLAGGKQKRVMGWKVLSLLITVCALAKATGVGIMAWMSDNEPLFVDGWFVGTSWVLSIAATGLEMLVVSGIITSRFLMEEEGGYELIPDRPLQHGR